MNWARIREIVPFLEGWPIQRIWLGVGISIFILLGAVLIFAKGSSSTEISARDVDVLEKLIALQSDLQNLKEDLEQRKIQGNHSRYSDSKQSYTRSKSESTFVGFTPKEGFQQINNTKTDLYIPRGSVFKARTLTSIKTSVAESFVVAETTKTFEMDSKRRIPKGTRLIGSAKLNPLLKGLIVRFDTMVLPSGKQIDGMRLLVLDQRAFPEVEGIYFSNKGETYGTALAFGFLSGFASAGQEREQTAFGSVAAPSVKNQVLGGLSTASFRVAEDALKDIREKSIEYVVLPAGEDCYVVFEEKFNVNPERGLQ